MRRSTTVHPRATFTLLRRSLTKGAVSTAHLEWERGLSLALMSRKLQEVHKRLAARTPHQGTAGVSHISSRVVVLIVE